MIVTPLLLLALSAISDPGPRHTLIELGGSSERGVLVNVNPGGQPFDPARPTVVFVHGFNPVPRALHFTMGNRLAEALARRGGVSFNAFAWNWNAAAVAGFDSRANEQTAINQGWSLAASLHQVGAQPAKIQMVGQSYGSLVAAAAARTLLAWFGQPIAQLTFLDPSALDHSAIFERQAAGSLATRVENFWTPGPSGFGRDAPYAGVWNQRVDGPTPYIGMILFARSNHLHVVEWYVSTAENPGLSSGFNRSVLLAQGTFMKANIAPRPPRRQTRSGGRANTRRQ
jgi:hypothetical protein